MREDVQIPYSPTGAAKFNGAAPVIVRADQEQRRAVEQCKENKTRLRDQS